MRAPGWWVIRDTRSIYLTHTKHRGYDPSQEVSVSNNGLETWGMLGLIFNTYTTQAGTVNPKMGVTKQNDTYKKDGYGGVVDKPYQWRHFKAGDTILGVLSACLSPLLIPIDPQGRTGSTHTKGPCNRGVAQG